MRFCLQSGSGKGYKKAKEYANKVKQCCEVCKKPICRKHSHKTSGVTCNNCKDGPLTSLTVAIDACYSLGLLASQRFRYSKGYTTFKHATLHHATLKHGHLNTGQINTRTYNHTTVKHGQNITGSKRSRISVWRSE